MNRLAAALGTAILFFSMLAGAQAQSARGLIVRLKDDASAEAAGAARTREQPRQLAERLDALTRDAAMSMRGNRSVGAHHHLLRFARPLAGAALDDAVRRLRLHPDVESVEPDVLLKPLQVAPNDPAFVGGQQDYLKDPAKYAAGVNLPAAWARTTGGAGAIVAVLDTGVRPGHPDLAGRLLPGYDFVSEVDYANDMDGRDADPSDPGDWVSASDKSGNPALFGTCDIANSTWHGTFIAGQIAALTDNGVGVAGVNWGNKVLPVRVSGKCGAYLSDILDAMRWAAGLHVDGVPDNATPARVINLSFGGDVACSVNSSYQAAIDDVTAAGTLVVVAAGNEHSTPRRPADCNNVLAVAAVQANGQKTDYSNLGSRVGIAAPGGSGLPGAVTNIYSTTNLGATGPGADSYGYKLGTSFSAPLAAGVASLMLSLNPALTPAQLIARMKASARAHVVVSGAPTCGGVVTGTCNCTTSTCGAGLLDADGATRAALAPVAVIAGVATPLVGTAVTLDGRASAAASGANIVSYQWTQVSGPATTLQGAAASVASAVLPVTAGTFQFRLVVTDDSGRTGEDTLTVTSATPVVATASGGGGGSLGWEWGLGMWLVAAWAWMRRDGLPRGRLR